MSQKPLTKSQQYWLTHIKSSERQGLSLKSYAIQQGIKLQALYDAKYRLVRDGVIIKERPSGFQKVKVQLNPLTYCTIRLPNGIQLEWPTDQSKTSLAGLLSILGANNAS